MHNFVCFCPKRNKLIQSPVRCLLCHSFFPHWHCHSILLSSSFYFLFSPLFFQAGVVPLEIEEDDDDSSFHIFCGGRWGGDIITKQPCICASLLFCFGMLSALNAFFLLLLHPTFHFVWDFVPSTPSVYYIFYFSESLGTRYSIWRKNSKRTWKWRTTP